MAHTFTFEVEVILERTQGKFASRDEMSDALVTMLEDANYGSVDGIGADGDSEYEVVDWEVRET